VAATRHHRVSTKERTMTDTSAALRAKLIRNFNEIEKSGR
jgi:hypothetical protein